MKKMTMIITTIMLTFVSLVTFNNSFATKNESSNTKVTIEEYNKNISDLKKISANELKNKIDNQESFIVYFGKETCPYCRNLSPVLKKFNDKINNSLFYFDINGKDNDDAMKNYIKNELNVKKVPTTLSFVKGTATNGWVGDDATVDKLYTVLYEQKPLENETSRSPLSVDNSETSPFSNIEPRIIVVMEAVSILLSLISLAILLWLVHGNNGNKKMKGGD